MPNHRINCSFFALALALAVFFSSGCGSESGDVSVTGKVTYKGQPLPSASLSFYPTDGSAVMATVVNGEYEAKLPAGDYRVTVTQGAPMLPAGWKDGDPIPKQAIVLPPNFESRVNTPLTATVAADQSAPVDFAME